VLNQKKIEAVGGAMKGQRPISAKIWLDGPELDVGPVF